MHAQGTPSDAPSDLRDVPPSSAWALLRRTVWRHRRRLLPGYLLITSWQLCETLVPVLIGVIIDEGVATRALDAFLLWCGALILLMAVLSVSYRFGGRLVLRSIEEEAHLLRTEVAGHVLHPRGARTEESTGETLSLATADAQLVGMVSRQLGYAIASMASITVVAVYLLSVDTTIALLILLGVPTVVLVTQVLTPLVARRTEQQQSSVAHASGVASDLVQGLRPLKGVGGEGAGVARYRSASATARDASIRMARSWGYLTGLTSLLGGGYLAVLVAVAGTRALQGGITLGELIAVVGVAQFLAEPINALGDLTAQAASSHASAGRLVGFLRTPRLIDDGSTVPTDDEVEVTLETVGSGPLVDVSLGTRRGTIVAVVAERSVDADALIDLLTGVTRPTSGRVALGGVELGDVTLRARRRHLVVSPHDAEIFEGTVRSVIDPEERLDDAALTAAITASSADDVVASHPDGLERHVRARGSSLSGGQRQRLALARALAAHPPVLVLHDPTTAIDSVTEQAVAEGLRRVRRSGGASTLVLTSSPALLDVADEVVLLRDGRVAARGTHATLLADDAYRSVVLR